MNNIILWGYYGKNNFGDDLMLDNICKYLTSDNNDNKISIITSKKSCTEISIPSNIKLFETFYNNKWRNLILFLKLFKTNKYFVWGGGTCFSDEDGVPNLIILLLAKLFSLKIYYIGVGIGNINNFTNKIKVKISSYLINKMYIRDFKSYYKAMKYFNICKLSLTEDIAYIYKFNKEKKQLNFKTLVVSLRNLDNYKSTIEQIEFINNTYFFLEHIIENDNYKVINILPLDSNSDICINSIIYNKLVNKYRSYCKINFVNENSYKYKLKVLQQSNCNVVVRLHGIMVSEISKVKTIAIIYADKVESFLKSIESENYVNISDVIYDKNSLIKYYYSTKKFDYNQLNIKRYYNKAIKNFNFLIEGKVNRYER